MDFRRQLPKTAATLILDGGNDMQPESDGALESVERRELLQRLGLLLGAAALPASAVFGAAAKTAPRFLDTAT